MTCYHIAGDEKMNQKNMTLQKEKNGNKEMMQPKKTDILYRLTRKEYKIYKKYKGITSSDYQTSQWNYF